MGSNDGSTSIDKPGAAIAEVAVWDPGVRLFHWLLVVSFAVAYVSAEEFDDIHELAGYAVAALIAFRIVWGFVGGTHARFADFLYGPTTVVCYLVDLVRFRAKRHLGHSPAGGAMTFALILCIGLTAATGLLLDEAGEQEAMLNGITVGMPAVAAVTMVSPARAEEGDGGEGGIGGDGIRAAHDVLANLSVLLVILHIAGVVLASVVHRENLARAMVTGRKRAA